MSNIITFNAPPRHLGFQDQAGSLISLFATQRRQAEDVFWLKENAELLGILECTGTKLSPKALEPFIEFHDTIADRLAFFPQYYRFLLSICLDVEDLGLAGEQGTKLCEWVSQRGLAEAELSDLQRAEAHRLLARRGFHTLDAGLNDRLRQFIARNETFAVPNKKAAYELTHIVFYLSEYGRTDPMLDADMLRSLQFAGILAYLDQNTDLLAEVCIALRFAGQTPSPIWVDYVMACLSDFAVETTSDAAENDQYHEFFVANWMAISADRQLDFATLPAGPVQMQRKTHRIGPLRNMSSCLYQMQGNRCSDWSLMHRILEQAVSPEGYEILRAAEQSSPDFEAFFEGFSRMNVAG